jgi:hypothetical protein
MTYGLGPELLLQFEPLRAHASGCDQQGEQVERLGRQVQIADGPRSCRRSTSRKNSPNLAFQFAKP